MITLATHWLNTVRERLGTVPSFVSVLAPWGLRWSSVSKFMRLRISQFAATIPLIGYLLLWSDKFKGIFTLQQVLGEGLWFDTTDRLKLIYYGAICLGIAWVIYQIRCPPVIKRHPAAEDFLFEQAAIQDSLTFRRIHKLVSLYVVKIGEQSYEFVPTLPITVSEILKPRELQHALINSHDEEHRSTVLAAYYHRKELRNPWSLCVSVLFATVGLVFVLLPSVEVFLLVTSKFRLL